MNPGLLNTKPDNAIAIIPVEKNNYKQWLEQQAEATRRWLQSSAFQAKTGNHCLLPADDHSLAAVVIIVDDKPDLWVLADLPNKLPAGDYFIDADWHKTTLEQAALGWGLACYRYDRYRKEQAKAAAAKLAIPDCDIKSISDQIASLSLARDLINTPAQDMMPQHLAEAITTLGNEFNAKVSQIIGDDLLTQNYPVIHAVGRASVHTPRLLDLRWGNANHPRVTLVGKGVCFDSGGLDIKPASGMRLMKKDMGGAAHAIGLARLIMSANLPICLRLLVPAVENAISGDAFRPGDVIRSRQGLTIEIDNTDAEGRLILCDALTEACTEKPEVLIDFATLTGAARVAVGTEIAAFFSNNDELAAALAAASDAVNDPIWRLPLYKPYRSMLDSKIADIANSAASPFAGASTAALFLQEFVPDEISWGHFDLMAWNNRARPGRPEGGEAMGLRAVFDYLQQRFASQN